MVDLLRKMYRKLPIVKEVRRLTEETTDLHKDLAFDGMMYWWFRAIWRIQVATFRELLLSQPRYREPKRLSLYEHQVYSQFGEDGIIGEIFRRIGTTDRTFLEVGVGNGTENNTACLLTLGWSGSWVDCDAEGIRAIRKNMARRLSDGTLKLIDLTVTRENIASALSAAGVPEELDLLSLDVDMNTYWIWSALEHIRARVVVVEYNSTYPPSVDWKVDYDPQGQWDGTFHYGASLKAFELLGRRFGYNLVGCNLAGCNAFFVKQELCGDHFFEPFDSETHYEPDRGYLFAGTLTGHGRGYGGLA